MKEVSTEKKNTLFLLENNVPMWLMYWSVTSVQHHFSDLNVLDSTTSMT
jgi:hypothetical protein